MKKLIITCAVAATAVAAGAQINNAGNAGALALGRHMAGQGNYTGALDQLRMLDRSALDLSERIDAAYDECRWLYGAGRYADAADAFSRFIAEYPFASQRISAQKGIADSYYARALYADALRYYRAVQASGLPDDEAGQCYYRMGIASLECDSESEAHNAFSSASRYQATRPDALFYLGKMAFDRRDYQEAAGFFRQTGGSKAPANQSGMYLASIELVQGNYRQALAKARQELGNNPSDKDMRAELNRIAGEALFKLGQPEEAVTYLRQYVDATEHPVPTALYVLGVEAFGKGDYAEALGYFRPVTSEGEGAVQQSAYLYAGQCLLEEGETDSAVLAFDKAAGMDFDSAVTEAAFFNFAVAKFSGGAMPFESGADTFEEFLRRYPSSVYADRVSAYLASGYMAGNDYERALERLRGVAEPSAEVNAAKQRVLYVLGTKALQEDNLDAAAGYLSEAQSVGSADGAMATEVVLTQGILYNRRQEFGQAAGKLRSYLRKAPKNAENRPVALYQLAYALYGGRDAAGAKEYFAQASAALHDPAARADALNRLGDIAAAHAQFDEAAGFYRKAYSANPDAADYAVLNEAKMKGYLRDYQGKLSALDAFRRDFPSSVLLPDALLETTEAQISLGRNDDAIRTYKELISTYPRTAQGRRGYIQMAMTYLDMGHAADAEDAYRAVIKLYPTSEEAAQAAAILKTLYAESGRGDEYVAFIETVEHAPKVSADEAEELEYSAAEAALKRGAGAAKMEQFVAAHPPSAKAATGPGLLLRKAIADNNGKADGYASQIIDRYPDSPAAEKALEYKGDAAYSAGDLPQALTCYTSLAEKASDATVATAARLRMMRTQRDMGRYADAGNTADAIIASSAGNAEIKEAKFTKAKALSEAEQEDAAIKLWLELADDAADIFGAKSAVEASAALLEQGNAKRALEVAKKFVNSGSPHRYWVARGFIVLSDAYKAQNKEFEARQYLEALRDNYPGSEPDIFMMIGSRLDELK